MTTKEKEFELAFGRNIRSLREEKNWSQEDLAYLVGSEGNQISRVEIGKHSPTLRTILAISKALGKQPRDLFNIGVSLDLNVGSTPKGKRRPKTKEVLFKLMETDFFEIPRSVDAVSHQCKKVFQIELLKPAISAILKDLVDRKKLIRNKDISSRGFLYKKRGK
ncbi:helix-turn-helix domain-containing protein [Dawidia soli]|uniref:Helix-turn-helix transcriptional regulator n=1 Tax=Dawidia soli TaxID=2782352 RepID=A0AAP2GFE8_9BACT|nr:helix-turn-helix transcriptional regulator [Dawidia soli]MBT1689422.1 helix-turn-helix transcriptional regulator [Dawidia soli]